MSNNITNNISNNVNYNVNVFLNEQCKDAMNLLDFVNNIQCQLEDLEYMGKEGYVEGISKVLIDSLSDMEVTNRPIHCTDSKRKSLYIKNNNEWHKDNNNVEMKKAILGEGAKANHLTYLGDAEVGAKANIGAGTITCNYDGVNKSKTVIGDNAFIGSNSSLVAPVSIGKGATVGAGSVITSTVDEDALAVARGKQMLVQG